MSNGVKAWSYSALKLYEECPFRYRLEKIDKVPVPEHPAMERGKKIHKDAEDFLTGKEMLLPPTCMSMGGQMRELREHKPMVEQEWAFNDRWKPTGWFAKDCWLRIKTDAALLYDDEEELLIVDHKTGRKYNDNEDQIELFALGGFCMFPMVKSVDTRLWYLDSGEEVDVQFERDKEGLADAKREWEDRVEPMFVDIEFRPRPNDKCKWCPHSRSKGGPCKY
jgi:RecB family exonuclease